MTDALALMLSHRLSRFAVSLLVLAAVLAPWRACAQGPRDFGNTPAARPPVQQKPKRTARGLTEFATEEPVAEIRVKGNKTVPASRIIDQMNTRVGRPYDPRSLAADIKKLASLPYFVTVRPLTKSTPTGILIVLEVTERATIRYIEYLGNEKINDKKLAKETGLTVGGAVDPYAVEEGRRKLEALYRSNGFGRVVVDAIEGTKPQDRGVTYVINEGPRMKIWSVEFEGNTFASDGQLKNKIGSKPEFAHMFGGKLEAEALEADIKTLTTYYRSFGFFKARVGRILDFSEDGKWANIRFIIHEGPRYQVRNVSFFGNEKFASEDLRDGMQMTDGLPFERAKLSVDTQWLRDLYGSRGYVFADIQPETVFLEEPGFVDLVYNIEEGESWRIGKILVKINGESSSTRIQTALNRLSVRPGDILDTRELRNSEVRLSRATIFNTNPAQGATPKITYHVSEEYKRRLAEEAERKERTQLASGQRRTAYKPPVDTVYSIEQSNASTPQKAFAWSGTEYADPGPPQGQRVYPPPADQFGGQQVGATGPGAAPVGYNGAPVQQLGVAAQGSGPRYTNQAQPEPAIQQTALLNGALPQSLPQLPVNTQVFPTQVYAPSPVPPPNDPIADLVVNLEETQTGRFMVGVAVNSDAGLVGQIMLDERNFDWRRFPRSWRELRSGDAFRGGGQRFRLEAAPGTEVQRYVASWQEPYLLDTPISLNLSGSYFDRRFDDWDEQRLGGRVALGYQWTDRDLSAQLTYRGEVVNIHEAAPAVGQLVEYDEVRGDNYVNGFGIRVINDTRDNPFLATEGYYVSATVEQVIGSFTYTRGVVDARTYYLLNERPDHTGRHVLTYQARLGFTGSDTPIYDRFYAGGFSTMRGFDFRGASPLRLGFEVGGDFQFLNTLEYLFPITADDMVRGVMFVDHGTVNENVSLDNYRVTPGVGLRLTIPAMGPAPIALDFGWPIAEADGDDKRVFTFNVGFQR